jgi:hypothetical protein
VFGMGTGVTLLAKPPKTFSLCPTLIPLPLGEGRVGLKTEQSLINKESLALGNWIIDYATDENWFLNSWSSLTAALVLLGLIHCWTYTCSLSTR